MSKEITVSFDLSFGKYGAYPFLGATIDLDMAGSAMMAIQEVGTGAEALILGEAEAGGAVPGLVIVENLDATNYVEIALDSGVSTKIFSRIDPSGVAIWSPYAAGTIYAKANTAGCSVRVFACEAITINTVSYHTAPVGTGQLNSIYTVTATLDGSTLSAASTRSVDATESYFTHSFFTFNASAPTPDLIMGTTSGGVLAVVNIDDEDALWVARDSSGADIVATCAANGGFCMLPFKQSGSFYGGGSNSLGNLLAVKG